MSRYDDLNPPSDQLANPDDKHEVERTKLSLLRYSVETQDPSSKEVDDGMLRRFLRARDMDVEKASTMFLKYLKWKHSFLPNGTSSITTSDISTDISHNKVFLQGTDRTGRPICVAFGGRHFQNKLSGGVMEEGQEKFMAIGDLEGWGYANSDIRGYLAALHILQDYYPERLGKLFIVHVPYVFMAVWKVIYPFIDSNTKKKIVFVDNKKLKSTLLEDIDESQLPEIYGGKMPLVPVHEA
ncbi:PATL5 [Linum perenne]